MTRLSFDPNAFFPFSNLVKVFLVAQLFENFFKEMLK